MLDAFQNISKSEGCKKFYEPDFAEDRGEELAKRRKNKLKIKISQNTGRRGKAWQFKKNGRETCKPESKKDLRIGLGKLMRSIERFWITVCALMEFSRPSKL